MRSPRLLATALLSALMIIALAVIWFRSSSRTAHAAANTAPPTPAAAAPAPADTATTLVHKSGWGPEDRDTITAYVDLLKKSDAEFICLTLGLIPRDEMFDDISYHRRLRRYVSRINSPDEFKDMEAAFRQLTQMRGGMPRPHPTGR